MYVGLPGLARTREARKLRPGQFACVALRRFTKSRYAPGDTFGDLAKESDARVDVHAFAVARVDQRAVEVRLAGIVHGQDRGVFWIKLCPVVESALLHPAFEVVLRDFVRAIQEADRPA